MNMESVQLIYKIKSATFEDIVMHLRRCSEKFQPALATRVSIEEYSRKIFEKATTFEAWCDNVLVGLLAAYFNGDSGCFAYITNVSVLDDFFHLGIASGLLRKCVQYAVKEKFKEIRLEVGEENHPAIALYQKFGFASEEVRDGFLKMRLIIQS